MNFTSREEYEGHIKGVLISKEEISEAVEKAGKLIDSLYDGSPILLVSILKGAFVFLADLSRAVSVPCEIGFMAAKSYFESTESSGNVEITLDLSQDISKYNVIIALGLVFIPSFARVTRTAFAALRDVNYVKSARLMGASPGRILVVHILPNTLSVLLPAITIGFNNAVLAEASMSFLGIGVTPPDASLGYMLSEAQSMIGAAPWYAIGTGLAIVVMVFSVGLIGEGLRRGGEED